MFGLVLFYIDFYFNFTFWDILANDSLENIAGIDFSVFRLPLHSNNSMLAVQKPVHKVPFINCCT